MNLSDTHRLTRTLAGACDKRPYNDRARTRAIIPARIVVIAEKRTIDSICSEYKVSRWNRLRAREKAGRISKRALAFMRRLVRELTKEKEKKKKSDNDNDKVDSELMKRTERKKRVVSVELSGRWWGQCDPDSLPW